MSLFEWASSFVGGSTNTQAGAIDIIAIRRADGSLSCSPFHVKLGKIPKKGEKKVVTLKVNGKDVPLSMKLGPAGEAFFVERTKEISFKYSGWMSPPTSPNGPLDSGVSSEFALTSPLNVHLSTQSGLKAGAVSGKVEATTAQQLRQRSYSESDLNEQQQHTSDPAAATSASAASVTATDHPVAPTEGSDVERGRVASTGSAGIATAALAGAGSSSEAHHLSVGPGGILPAYRRDRSISDLSNVSSLPPLILHQQQQQHSAVTSSGDNTVTVSQSARSQTSGPPPVSWIWSWGALPKKNKSNKSLADLSKAESKHQTHTAAAAASAGSGAVSGGVSGGLLHPSGDPSDRLELRPTADDPPPRGAGFGSPAAAHTALAAPGSAVRHTLSRITESGSSSSSGSAGSGIKPLSSLLENLDNSISAATAAPAAASSSIPGIDHALLSADSDAKPARSSRSQPEYREAENEEKEQQGQAPGQTPGEEEDGDDEEGEQHMHCTRLPALSHDTDQFEEEQQQLYWEHEEGRTRLLSLCGHILAGDVTAPEPVPLNSRDLLKVLYSYRVTDSELSSSSMAQSLTNGDSQLRSNLVIVIDDYLLTLEVAERLVMQCGGGESVTDESSTTSNNSNSGAPVVVPPATMSLTAELIQKAIADTVNTASASGSSSNGDAVPVWVGAKISNWGVSTATSSAAPGGASGSAVVDPVSGHSPISSLIGSHHSSSRPHFVTWSSDHLGWRDSFSDLVNAYKYSHSHNSSSRLAALDDSLSVSSGNSGGTGITASGMSHSDFLKAYIASTPASTQHTPGSAGYTRSRRLSDPTSTANSASSSTAAAVSGAVVLNSHLDAESDYFIPSQSMDESDNSCNNSMRLSNDQLHQLIDSSIIGPAVNYNTSSASATTNASGAGAAHSHSLLLPLPEGENEDAVTPPPEPATPAVVTPVPSSPTSAAATASALTSPPRIISPGEATAANAAATSTAAAPVVVPAVPIFRGTVSVSDLPPYNPSTANAALLDADDLTDPDHTSLSDPMCAAAGGGGPTDTLSLEDIDLEDIDPAESAYDSDTDSYLSYDDVSDSGGSRGRTPRGGGPLSSSNSFDGAALSGGGAAAGGGGAAGGALLGESLKRRLLPGRRYRYRKVLVPSRDQLELLGLTDGENEITFQVEGCAPLKAQLFVWPENVKILVTDIEGILLHKASRQAGGWVSFLGGSSSRGVTNHSCNLLLNAVSENNYRILYFTQSTPLVSSKDYLASLASTPPPPPPSSVPSSSSGGSSSITSSSIASSSASAQAAAAAQAARAAAAAAKCPLKIPNGPIFKSPETLIRTFGAERTDVFKATALRGIKNLFPHNHNPYHACFASRLCDVNAFSRFGFPDGRIFLVDDKGDLHTTHRLKKTSYQDLQELVHQIFPYYQDVVIRTVPKSLPPPPPLVQSVEESVTSPGETSKASAGSGDVSGKVPPLSLTSLAPTPTHQQQLQQTVVAVSCSNTSAEDTYNDFNFWRMPLPVLDD